MRLLIAEDDQALSSFLKRGLCGEGNEVEIAHDGETALDCFLRSEPDLLILDLQLPGRSGMDVLTAVREVSALCPVMILSGCTDKETRIHCLNSGADDYLAKPFSLDELRARCRAMLRRHQATRDLLEQAGASTPVEESSSLISGALQMQRVRRQVEIAGEPVRLTNREFSLLEQLLLADGDAVSRTALREAVWEGKALETNILDVHVAALRRKLSACSLAPTIETVRGAGFRLVSQMVPSALLPQTFNQAVYA